MDEEYSPFEDKLSAVLHYSQKISEHFHLLHYKQTGFHEVDIKRYEARQCVVFGLGISAIVMISVTLEECLKTLLKYHYFLANLKKTPDPDLAEWEKTSIDAEDAFGSYRLHNAIQKARKENLITEDEGKRLLNFKEFIRNAFVHSDKSKLFDDKATTRVHAVKLEDGALKYKGNREMNILGLNFAQAFAEKGLADKECPRVLDEIDSIIVGICERFWETHFESHNAE